MKEAFLHYLWQFQKFSKKHLVTTAGESIEILKVGEHNRNSGPDFLLAQVSLDGQLWAGNVEIHVKSSDWYQHRHQNDPNYDNVILHVVLEHDAEVFRKDETIIPTLQLKERIPQQLLKNYNVLFLEKKRFIPCENQFPEVDPFVLDHWLGRMYVERLETKYRWILQELQETQNNWEALLFKILAKGFGLKVNGEAFHSIAKSVPFSVLKKGGQELLEFEALLFGQAGFLERSLPIGYYKELQDKYRYSKIKWGISNEMVTSPKFFRLRPPNFPTLRLSQLAMLWTSRPHLFSEIIAAKTKEEFYTLFDVAASDFWDDRYNFEIESSKRRKGLTKGFIDLLLINAVIPIKFAYAKHQGKDVSEALATLALSIKAEKNSLMARFQELRTFESTAWHSQALLQLKNEHCEHLNCLNCVVGNFVLKQS